MGTFRKLWNGAHGGFFRYAVVVTALAALFLLIGPGTNLVRWARAKVEIGRQERTLRRLEREIGEMDARYRSLTGDRDSLEHYAREHFRLAAPGDDVYVLEK